MYTILKTFSITYQDSKHENHNKNLNIFFHSMYNYFCIKISLCANDAVNT
jgi:hypothetical protein